MKVFVGTSGWLYGWNKGKSLEWYLQRKTFNVIELNTSFYRFPSPNNIAEWGEEGKKIAWIPKVNQLITHRFKFSRKSYSRFSDFLDLFSPIERQVHFYLFQIPPIITPNLLDRIINFADRFGISKKFALEARNLSWFDPKVYERLAAAGITMVSTDSPLGSFIMKSSDNVYLRIHGRKEWYNYNYSKRELSELAIKITKLKPKNSYVLFNNDHNMLSNGEAMLKIMKKEARKSLPA